jgi:hypothetical protein
MAPVDQGDAARIRDLCRRLKPIVGQQAERIWLAYVAEDEEGKTQIEEYLELMAAQHLLGSIESEGPGLIPPGSSQADGEYRLGTVAYNNLELYPFGLRENEWTQHVGVFGRSGAGKTNLGFLLVQQLIQAGKPVLIFDWKRNYRDLLTLPGFEDMAVYTIGRPISPLSFNPLIPPAGTNPKTWLKKLIAVVAHAYLLGDGVIYLLQEAIDRVYEQAGVYSGKIERWPTFRDVLNVLKTRNSPGREAGWLSSALRALSSLCFGEMDVLLNQGEDDLAALLSRPVVLELDALIQSDKVFFVEALLLWVHHYRMAEPSREQFKHAIVVEEAHHILTNERQSLAGGQSVMEITFREIREFGEAMIILDQHPSQISIPALGNAYCTICFNLKHRTDVSAMAQAMMLKDDEKDTLGNIQIGQAVVRVQGRSVKPFLIAVPEFMIHKGAIADARVTSHMTALGLLSSRRHKDSHPPISSDAAGPSPELAFLADVAEFPAGGVAERYKRLGLSVRQGQKFKARLIARTLIQEETQITHKGKLHVIRLTETGRLALSDLGETRSGAA